MNKALYPGSFDPFTVGHLSVLEKAVKVFDEVYVVFSQNPKKKRRYDVDRSIYALTKFLETKNFYDNKVQVFRSLDSIPARIAKEERCDYIVRGLRNNMDYDYEEGLAKFNNEVCPEVETIYFRADKDEVSSTMVYSLDNAGIDVNKYLPYDYELLRADSIEIGKLYEYLRNYQVKWGRANP
jgi:pantetheine-phosphate adenylyltransferase